MSLSICRVLQGEHREESQGNPHTRSHTRTGDLEGGKSRAMTAESSPGDLHTGPGQSGDGREVADQASVDSGRDVESARRWNCGVGESRES